MKIHKWYKLTREIGFLGSNYWLYLKKFNKKKYDIKILELLKSENLSILEYYSKNKENKVGKIKSTDCIWFFWWQGKEEMPDLVRSCYETVKKYSLNHEVIFLSRDNYKDYANFPDNILKKLFDGNYSLTHFSDILRMNLLSNKGGIWIDSTIYLTDDFTKEFDNKYSIYTRKSKKGTEFISNGMWSGYFIATSKNNILPKICYDILCNYWEKHNVLVEYLLIDYVIYLVYTEIKSIKAQIDSIPCNNEGIHELEKVLGDMYISENYEKIRKLACVHKLNWKKKYIKKSENNEQTYYGYVIDR